MQNTALRHSTIDSSAHRADNGFGCTQSREYGWNGMACVSVGAEPTCDVCFKLKGCVNDGILVVCAIGEMALWIDKRIYFCNRIA